MLWPPSTLRPRTRLENWIGIRRWPWSTKMMPAVRAEHQTTMTQNWSVDAVGLHERELGGDLADDAHEDDQRHAVADAALGDQLTEPHDEGRAGRQGEHHDAAPVRRVVGDQVDASP